VTGRPSSISWRTTRRFCSSALAHAATAAALLRSGVVRVSAQDVHSRPSAGASQLQSMRLALTQGGPSTNATVYGSKRGVAPQFTHAELSKYSVCPQRGHIMDGPSAWPETSVPAGGAAVADAVPASPEWCAGAPS
jgi:hypothetical protein